MTSLYWIRALASFLQDYYLPILYWFNLPSIPKQHHGMGIITIKSHLLEQFWYKHPEGKLFLVIPSDNLACMRIIGFSIANYIPMSPVIYLPILCYDAKLSHSFCQTLVTFAQTCWIFVNTFSIVSIKNHKISCRTGNLLRVFST